MNKRKAWPWTFVGLVLVLVGMPLLAGCTSEARVGALRTESKSVELGDAKPVRVNIDMGAGDLAVAGGAEKLMEADFTYNVERLKPQVEYRNQTLSVTQPEAKGLPNLQGIAGFRNEWGLRLHDEVPMDLSVNMGAGTSELTLSGLSLTGLAVTAGAGTYTIDLRGDWTRDLNVDIEAGAATVNVRLPEEIGARVEVESGPHTIQADGMTKDGGVYTNAAYGVSDVTMQVKLQVGIGQINLDVDRAAATANNS